MPLVSSGLHSATTAPEPRQSAKLIQGLEPRPIQGLEPRCAMANGADAAAGPAPAAVYQYPTYGRPHSSTYPLLLEWGIFPREWQFMVMNPHHWQVRVDDNRETPTSKKEEENKNTGKTTEGRASADPRGAGGGARLVQAGMAQSRLRSGPAAPGAVCLQCAFFPSQKKGRMVYGRQKMKEVWMHQSGSYDRIRTEGRRGEPHRRAPW